MSDTFGKSHELKTFLQGRYQAAVIDVDLETINDLRQDSNIEMVGTEALVDSFRVDDYTLNVNFRDSNNLYLYSTEFVGNLPDKENEVAVSEAYLKHIGRPVELNQEIELPLQNGKNANFTVCGLLHDDGANRRYQVLVSDSFLQSYFQDHIPYESYHKILHSIMASASIDQQTAEKLYRHLWVYTHGIACLCATKTCQFSEQETQRMLTEVFQSLLKNMGTSHE